MSGGRDDSSFLNLMGMINASANPNVGSSTPPTPSPFGNLSFQQQQQLLYFWQQNNAEQSTPPTPHTQSSQAASVEVEPEATSPRKTKRGGKRAAKKGGKRLLVDEMTDFEKNPDVSETTLRWTPEEEVLLAVCWAAVSEDRNIRVS